MFKNIEELKQYLCENASEETIVLDNPSFLGAVIGVSDENRCVYSYPKMIEWLMKEEGMTYEDAADFVSYNTVRALPYMGDMAPIIVYDIEE